MEIQDKKDVENLMDQALDRFSEKFDLAHRHIWNKINEYEETKGFLGLHKKKVIIQECYQCREIRKI